MAQERMKERFHAEPQRDRIIIKEVKTKITKMFST